MLMLCRLFTLAAHLNGYVYPFEILSWPFERLIKALKCFLIAFACRSFPVYFGPFERLTLAVHFPVEGHNFHSC